MLLFQFMYWSSGPLGQGGGRWMEVGKVGREGLGKMGKPGKWLGGATKWNVKKERC